MNSRPNALLAVACAAAMLISVSVHAADKDHTFPNKVKTHIGTLTFDHGVPTKETSKKLYYELD